MATRFVSVFSVHVAGVSKFSNAFPSMLVTLILLGEEAGISEVAVKDDGSWLCRPDCSTCSSLAAITGFYLVRASARWAAPGVHLMVERDCSLCSSRIVASIILFFASSGSFIVEQREKIDLESTTSSVV